MTTKNHRRPTLGSGTRPEESAAADVPKDTLGRPLRDMRISVTDRRNFRCSYCMPKELFGRAALTPQDGGGGGGACFAQNNPPAVEPRGARRSHIVLPPPPWRARDKWVSSENTSPPPKKTGGPQTPPPPAPELFSPITRNL